MGALKRWGWNPLTNFDKWPYLKYFKTCTVNLVIPRLNLQSFTISKKSKVTIWHFCQITWLVPNSFVTWFRFNQWGGVVAYSGYRGTLENWTVLKKSAVCFVIITRNKISWFMKKIRSKKKPKCILRKKGANSPLFLSSKYSDTLRLFHRKCMIFFLYQNTI